MTIPEIDTQYMLNVLTTLLNIPSPTGFTHQVIDYLDKILAEFQELKISRTHKGALLATWPGRQADRSRALTAHVDTLGAMVQEIKSNGRLKLTHIGSYAWNTVEGEGCTIFSSRGEPLRGSILLNKASAHVHGSAVNELKRGDDNMEIRLDAETSTAEGTRALGISVGDFIAFDPRVEVTNNFVRSRHLDDKAGAATMIAAIKSLHDAGLQPVQTTTFHFSNYEEVGHGAAGGLPEDITELVAVDMAAVGEGQASDEFHATLCAKDSGGPYHYELSQKLRQLAEEHNIPHKVDIYPYYGSDGGAYWRAGGDVAVALIGPGVDASHNYERTHLDALLATTKWVMVYVLS